MWNTVIDLLQGRLRAVALALLAVALPLQGCIVDNGSSRGSILVYWDTPPGTSCNSMGIASVNVVVAHNGMPYGTFSKGACAAGAMTIEVVEGSYAVHVEGIAYDGTVIAVSPTVSVPALAYSTVSTAILELDPTTPVNNGLSSIQATWTIAGQSAISGCGANGVKTVVLSIIDASQTKVLATAQANCASGYATVGNLGSGTYYVQLDGYTAGDASGQPSWGTPGLKGPLSLGANTDLTFNTPLDITKLGATTTVGGLSLGWTVFGKAAASGCTTYSIDKLNVTVLAADRTTELGSAQVSCGSGQISFSNLPAGNVYLRIDEANPPDTSAYGNVNLGGPFAILANQTSNVTTPIDIGQRTLIAIPLAFADGGSCGSHGVGNVQYQIIGNDKLIVPFNDADATKPCDLTGMNYKQRVIDLDNSPAACAVPPGATGLVICNAHGISKLTIQAHGIVNNTISYAAKMDVTGLSDGKLTKVNSPIALQACSGGDPLCQ